MIVDRCILPLLSARRWSQFSVPQSQLGSGRWEMGIASSFVRSFGAVPVSITASSISLIAFAPLPLMPFTKPPRRLLGDCFTRTLPSFGNHLSSRNLKVYLSRDYVLSCETSSFGGGQVSLSVFAVVSVGERSGSRSDFSPSLVRIAFDSNID